MPMSKNNVFVDFDGTIADVFPRFYGILSNYIEQYFDEELDYSMYRELKRLGKKDHVIVKELIYGLEINIENYMNYKRERLESFQWLQKDNIIGDPKDAYEKFKIIGYDVVLLTQRNNKNNLLKQIDTLKIDDCFDDIVVVKPEEGKNVKAQYIEKCYCNKDIIIGDSKVEIEVSRVLNIQGYFVNTGLISAPYAGVYDMVFENYNSVVNYLLLMNNK